MTTKLALIATCLALLAGPAAPAAKELVTVLAAGSSLVGWSFYRDQARLDGEYTQNQLATAGGSLDWSFSPRTVNYADIFLVRAVAAPFDRLEVEVSNPGAALELVGRLVDEKSSEYISERTPLPAGAPWRRLSWRLETFQLGWWSHDVDRRPDFPLVAVSLTTYQVAPGQHYQLRFRNLRLVHEVGSRVRLASGRLPPVWRPGSPQPLHLGFSCLDWRQVAGREVVLEGYRDDRLAFTRHLGDLPARGPALITVPRFAPSPHWPPGRYQVAVRVGSALAALQEVTVPDSAQPAPRPSVCQVKPYHGAPTLFLNGQPSSSLVYMTYRPRARHFRQFAQAGVHLYSFSSTPTEAGYGLAPPCWVAPDRFDYSGIDAQAAQVLDEDPQAYFFPRLYLHSPAWWDERHPDHLVTYDPGDGHPLPFFHQPGKRAPSWASDAWRRDTAQALRRYIRHLQASSYADRVIGYHLASGTTEEWMQWGANEDQWVDYSPVNLAKFRRWLRSRYHTEAALRRAWADPQAAFAAAAIPTRAERAAAELGCLRDPATAGRCIDYVRYNSWLVADTIRCFARVVKQETHRQALVGVFYGYVLQLAGEQREQNAGHLALSDVLRCPDVDFITSPSSYAFRQLGTGYSHFMSLLDSVKLHGKLWFDENDIRTWLTREGDPGDATGKTATYQETLLHQQRELANVLANACGMWWFDMSAGWYDDPRILADLARLKQVGDASVAWDRSPAAQIALVVDDASSAYLQVSGGLSHHFLVRQLPELGRVGAPFAYLHLADLDRAPEYKLYLFPNCLAPTEQQRRLIEQKVKRGGHLVVWLWAPGLVRHERLDPPAMQALTGIRLVLQPTAAPLQVKVGGEAAWVGEAAGTSYGLAAAFAPTLFADDEAALTLGTLAGGQAGLVAKQLPGWTSVYSAAPVLPHTLLRALAQRAGVHLYAPAGDVVYANRSLLAVSVNQGGPRTLHLPGRADVFDLYQGQDVGQALSQFTVDIPPCGTRLFRLRWVP